MDIKHVEQSGRGAFLIKKDGERIAEMTYAEEGDGAININHTEVDPSLRGQGVGEQLLDAAVAFARESGKRVKATCPYAVKKLRDNESYTDIFDA
jgi:predicted GNAT family acetyltransferase